MRGLLVFCALALTGCGGAAGGAVQAGLPLIPFAPHANAELEIAGHGSAVSRKPGIAAALAPVVITPVGQRPVTGTLYVSDRSSVYSFPAGASGSAPPQRTITGRSGSNFRFIDGIATLANGQLWVLQGQGESPMVSMCNVFVLSAGANGSSGELQQFVCAGTLADGIARGPNGEMDVMTSSYAPRGGPSGPKRITRYDNGAAAGSFNLPDADGGLATDANGNVYTFNAAGGIDEFDAQAASGAAPIRSITLPSAPSGQLTIAPDGTLYAGSQSFDSTNYPTAYVYAVAPGATTPSRRLGPFGGGAITALVTGSRGELYVGLAYQDARSSAPARTNVSVFAADANCTMPQRVLLNPVPAGSRVSSLAFAQEAAARNRTSRSERSASWPTVTSRCSTRSPAL